LVGVLSVLEFLLTDEDTTFLLARLQLFHTPYLAVVLDIFSRMVVGWAMDQHRDEALVEQAALMALARRHPEPELTSSF